MEEHQIPTVSITLFKEMAEQIKPPRSLFVRFPYGSPLGQPKQAEQQMNVLKETLELAINAKEPGTIKESSIKFRG
ncbi:hypothetical protein LS684_09275 [Cytobacillus spongiae]|uniref:hypothetical protein n=1 Tax=Cytobacillus spongiae TaxID=2901381 RepID=UPI001F3442B0|nr:hypothetical protein [Cytobacillus spongiae]UII57595.1 hypothetical protein LS684_09275 [Cytobacillus spongiae]